MNIERRTLKAVLSVEKTSEACAEFIHNSMEGLRDLVALAEDCRRWSDFGHELLFGADWKNNPNSDVLMDCDVRFNIALVLKRERKLNEEKIGELTAEVIRLTALVEARKQ